MKRTTITLPDDLAALVDHEARRRGSSVSDVIRQTISAALVEKIRKIPFAAICDDQDLVTGEEMEQALEGWGDDIDRRGR